MNLKNINNKKIVLLFQVHIFAYFWKQDGEIMASYDLHICYTIWRDVMESLLIIFKVTIVGMITKQSCTGCTTLQLEVNKQLEF